jgi:hypothetical protein
MERASIPAVWIRDSNGAPGCPQRIQMEKCELRVAEDFESLPEEILERAQKLEVDW